MSKNKRSAGFQLTQDNWEEYEEEQEEAGSFKRASEEELSKRVIKTARKRLTDGSGSGSSVFSRFQGFSQSSSVTPGASTFSFLKNISSTSEAKPTVNGSGGSATTLGTNSTSSFTTPKLDSNTKSDSKDKVDNAIFESSTEYYTKLKELNISVANWIKKHVDQSPVCILTPIFKDYEKFLKELEALKDKKTETLNQKQKSNETETPTSVPASQPAAAKPAFSFNTGNAFKPPSTEQANSLKTTIPSFGNVFGNKSTTDVKDNTTSMFSMTSQSSFGSGPLTASSTGFSFGSGGKPFTFQSVSHPANIGSSTATKEEDEDEEPPKVEFKAVVEEDSVYSKRCKVFVKSKGKTEYSDRGVGTLYLKEIEDGKKAQLLVRADTNLGNILLNILISEGIPAERMGKNNVLLVCVPTPESEQKAVSVLVRVKTGEEADELLDYIKKYKISASN